MADEDIGLKIGSKDEKFWTDLKEKIENDIDMNNKNVQINSYLLGFIDGKIEEEQKKCT